MEERHDAFEMIVNGSKNIGLVVKHYDGPLDDFYILYSDNSLIEWHNSDDYIIIADDVFMPAYDATLSEIKLRRQRVEDYMRMNEIIDSLKEMRNIGI